MPTFPLPDRWPSAAVAILAMVLLAALDLVGALLARAWMQQRTPGLFIAGAGVFALLFWVYGSSLRYAELATVTFGWIVLLQVALVLIDRFRNGLDLGLGKWTAVVLVLALEGYLLMGPPYGGSPGAG